MHTSMPGRCGKSKRKQQKYGCKSIEFFFNNFVFVHRWHHLVHILWHCMAKKKQTPNDNGRRQKKKQKGNKMWKNREIPTGASFN